MKNCVIYTRTSSLTNCGEDKDSHQRQEQICVDYCKSNRLSIQAIFYDEGVSGKVLVFNRSVFRDPLLGHNSKIRNDRIHREYNRETRLQSVLCL